MTTDKQLVEMDRMEERLRRSFQHVLWLGSRDLDSSKWYAEELAKIAASEVREFLTYPPGLPSGANNGE